MITRRDFYFGFNFLNFIYQIFELTLFLDFIKFIDLITDHNKLKLIVINISYNNFVNLG